MAFHRIIPLIRLSVFFYPPDISILYLISPTKKLEVPYYNEKAFYFI
jgi:hypothetical protein